MHVVRELHRAGCVKGEKWWDSAACSGRSTLMLRQHQTSNWFDCRSEERRIKAALDLCAGCPVRHECLADAKAGRRLVGKQVGDVIGGVLSDEIGVEFGIGPGDGSRQRPAFLAIIAEIREKAKHRSRSPLDLNPEPAD